MWPGCSSSWEVRLRGGRPGGPGYWHSERTAHGLEDGGPDSVGGGPFLHSFRLCFEFLVTAGHCPLGFPTWCVRDGGDGLETGVRCGASVNPGGTWVF